MQRKTVSILLMGLHKNKFSCHCFILATLYHIHIKNVNPIGKYFFENFRIAFWNIQKSRKYADFT